MFDNNPQLRMTSRIAARETAVEEAIALTRDYASSTGGDPDAIARLLIVVEELVANLIEHGNQPEHSEIELELAALGADTGVTLIDGGTYFDPRSAPGPTGHLPEQGAGAGLALVRTWSRIIDYAREGERNILRLIVPGHV